MYIRTLRLRDVRTFVDVTLELNVPGSTSPSRAPANVTVIAGDNAVGKTTLLRGIAIAALAARGEIPSRTTHSIVRRGQGSRVHTARLDAEVALDDGRVDRIEVELRARRTEHDGARVKGRPDAPSGRFFVVGYGATRDLRSRRPRTAFPRARPTTPYEQVASLFEIHSAFAPPAKWLERLARADAARHAEVLMLLRDLAGPGAELLSSPRDARASRALHAFSDGQRAHVAWVTDTLRAACESVPSEKPLADARGLVLVDQIEQHVHARWLAALVPSIARALPKVQLVVTTHSPIVVGSVWRSNVAVLESHGDAGRDGTTIGRPTREVFGLSVDQLLATGVFGDTSARNGDMTSEIGRAARTAQEGDADSALRLLRLLSLGGGAIERAAPGDRHAEIAGAR